MKVRITLTLNDRECEPDDSEETLKQTYQEGFDNDLDYFAEDIKVEKVEKLD